jgi:subtilisin family serine protease
MRADESRHDWEERVTDALIEKEEIAEWPGGREGGGFMYRPNEVIVDRDAYEKTGGLREELRLRGGGEPVGVQRITPKHPIGHDPQLRAPSLRFRLEVTDTPLPRMVADLRKKGYPVDCNYIIAAGQRPKFHPGDDPEYGPVLGPLPDADLSAGSGVKVAVIDTGFYRPAAESAPDVLAGVVGEDDWLYEVTPGPEEDLPGYLLEAGGHGTFVAGLVRRVAPGAEVFVFNAGTPEGFGDLGILLAKLTQAFDLGCQVINISMGTYTLDDQPLVVFDQALASLRSQSGRDVVVVASAGNDGIERKGWPAASDTVIGVASLDDDGNLSTFSNRGPWVKAAAPGEKVASVFVPGVENIDAETDERPEYWRDHFRGPGNRCEGDEEPEGQWAEWSGTSFAAPLVSGALAVEIAAGASPSDAAANLLSPGVMSGADPGPAPIQPTFQLG